MTRLLSRTATATSGTDTAEIVLDRAVDIGVIVESLAREGGLPAVIHCAAGKDRTGVVSAVLLLALGVDDATVLDDYELTSEYAAATRVEELTLKAIRVGSAAGGRRRPVGYQSIRPGRCDHSGARGTRHGRGLPRRCRRRLPGGSHYATPDADRAIVVGGPGRPADDPRRRYRSVNSMSSANRVLRPEVRSRSKGPVVTGVAWYWVSCCLSGCLSAGLAGPGSGDTEETVGLVVGQRRPQPGHVLQDLVVPVDHGDDPQQVSVTEAPPVQVPRLVERRRRRLVGGEFREVKPEKVFLVGPTVLGRQAPCRGGRRRPGPSGQSVPPPSRRRSHDPRDRGTRCRYGCRHGGGR